MNLANYLTEYLEGGHAVAGERITKTQINQLFDIIKNEILKPMSLRTEGKDYVKVGSWSAANQFENDKTFGDIDIAINSYDTDFVKVAESISSVYKSFIEHYPQKLNFPQPKIMKGLKTVSIAIPLDGHFYQIDFFIPDNFDLGKFHFVHTEHTKIKAKFRNILLNSLIKLKNKDYRYSLQTGIKISQDKFIKSIPAINKLLGYDITKLDSFTSVWNKIKEMSTQEQQREIKDDLYKHANDEEKKQLDEMMK